MDTEVIAPDDGDDWCALSALPLPVDRALGWTVLPGSGAQVVFTGTVRDHAEGRSGVSALEYEAYEEYAVPKLHAVAGALRERWPAVARVALLHRTGRLALGDIAVVVAVSAPHRAEAFEAARFAIDEVKATVPIWKKEIWSGGEDWGTDATPVDAVASDGRPRRAAS